MPSPLAQFDYASTPTFGQRLRAKWGVIVVMIALIVVAFAVNRWGPQFWAKGKLLRLQRQCMEYAPPAGQMVYGEWPGALFVQPTDPAYAEFDWPGGGPKSLVRTPAMWTAFDGSPEPLKAMFSEDRQTLSVGLDSAWDLRTGRFTSNLTTVPRFEMPPASGLDGPSRRARFAAIHSNDGTINWFHSYGAVAASLVAFGPEGKLALVYCQDGKANVWDVVGNRLMLARKLPKGGQPKLIGQMSPTGSAMAVAGMSGGQDAVYVWNLPSADTVWRLNCPAGNTITGLAFSPDGRLLAVANPPGPVLVWKLDESLVTPAQAAH